VHHPLVCSATSYRDERSIAGHACPHPPKHASALFDILTLNKVFIPFAADTTKTHLAEDERARLYLADARVSRD
jgi:hypothetical protein